MFFLPSGGLLYHLRALRSDSAWSNFRSAIHTWLTEWSSDKHDELILIGPSGGYTLTSDWLNQFSEIYAYDLDPLAPFFFKLKHRQARQHFHRTNVFYKNGKLSAEPLAKIIAAHPSARILFSNVLGQVLLEGKATEEEWRAYLVELRAVLKGRDWASYHDLFTHERGHIIDHLMDGTWKNSLPKANFEWPLTPRSRHVIEGIYARKSNARNGLELLPESADGAPS